jgi:tetratricopeptide (TPR) repeat protein
LTTDPTRVYESLGFQVTAARLALDKKQNEECIQYYDRLLEAMPNWTSGYYNRGVCKDGSALKLHDLESYKVKMADALVDVDKAIALGPVKGKYFAERGYIYRNIQEVIENSTSEQAALKIAIDNIQTGINLGDEPNLQADLPSFLHESGQCQESVDLAKKLLETGIYDLNIKTLLYDSIATGYLCLGDYSSAKPVMEKRIQMSADCDAYSLQTSILIGLGEQDQAYKIIDGCIKDSPNFGGYRYYLRSLIHWDRGEKELARQDLQAGAGNTWSHGGLCAYVAGLVALDDGDQASGKELLKYAESTFKNREGLWVKDRIRSSLASLNIPQQDPTPVVTFQVTPIIFQQLTPAPPATQSAESVIPPTDVPGQDVSPDETSPVPAGYEDAILVDFNVGTGPLVLAAGDYPLFHFRPSTPIAVRLAKEIHFYLAPEGKDPSPVQVYLWTKDGGWRMMKPHWGDNLVDHPSSYISPTGDTYIAIRNYSTNTTVRIDNVSLLVAAELTNSDLKTYGKGK